MSDPWQFDLPEGVIKLSESAQGRMDAEGLTQDKVREILLNAEHLPQGGGVAWRDYDGYRAVLMAPKDNSYAFLVLSIHPFRR